MVMRARAGGRRRRPMVIGAMLTALCSVASCSASAEVPQRVEQAAANTTGSRATAVPPAATVADGPTQMWVDGGAIGEHTVIVRTGLRVAVYDATTLAPRWQRDHAVLSADRRTAVSSAPAAAGGGTTIDVVDVRTGAIRRTIELAQPREVVAVSSTGTRAALVDTLTRDPATGMPLGREASHVDIVDLASIAPVAHLKLGGNFVPEAFDQYGGVAIIQYVPAAKPERYRVRTLDVKTGAVTNVLTRDKTEIVDEMQGYGRAAIAKRDGSALFTLYRDGGRWGSAFVHQLVGEGQFAFCIDLPETGFDDASTIALSPDDRDLYVAGAKGAVAVIDARENFGPLPVAVKKMLWVPGVVGTPTAMAVTADTVWLLVDGQIVVADRATGERVTAHPAGDAAGIGVSEDSTVRVLADHAAGLRRL